MGDIVKQNFSGNHDLVSNHSDSERLVHGKKQLPGTLAGLEFDKYNKLSAGPFMPEDAAEYDEQTRHEMTEKYGALLDEGHTPSSEIPNEDYPATVIGMSRNVRVGQDAVADNLAVNSAGRRFHLEGDYRAGGEVTSGRYGTALYSEGQNVTRVDNDARRRYVNAVKAAQATRRA